MTVISSADTASASLRRDFRREALDARPALPATAADTSLSVVFENVGKIYRSSSGPVHALHGIDLSIKHGSIFGIIGRSGAGKSSLLRTINRLEAPTSGRVLVEGQDVAALDAAGLIALRRRVGMVFQHFNLMSAKTAWSNIALPLVVSGAPKARIDARVAEVVALTGLEGKERVYPSRLSGGQKQRVGIARALVHRPDILLCDEATSALDPETERIITDNLRRRGCASLVIAHRLSTIRDADEILVLSKGKVVERGRHRELMELDGQYAALLGSAPVGSAV